MWRGVAPFFKFIHKYYEPAFLDLFLRPNNIFGAVTAGAAGNMPELNWERYVEIMLDGLRAPGVNKLPPPRALIQR